MITKIKTLEALKYFQTLKNRTIWEEEIANEYFWPFKHQEACRGEDFDRRSNWSFTLCDKGKDLYLEVLAEFLADYQLPKSGIIQDEVLELLTGVISKVILGRHASLVKNRYLYLGITEYDRRIKLAKLKNKKLRSDFGSELRRIIYTAWQDPDPNSLLGIAKLELPDIVNLYGPEPYLGYDDFVDHLISVFLITGTIQLADAAVHCLLSKDSDSFIDTMMKFPVNKSLTREYKKDILYLRPETFNAEHDVAVWIFGGGLRRCPASAFAPQFVTTLVQFYRQQDVQLANVKHTRNLAQKILYRRRQDPRHRSKRRPKIPQTSYFSRQQMTYWLNVIAVGIIVFCRVIKRKISF